MHDQVANQVRDLIGDGYLEPGPRIDETELVARLGMSRTPPRGALRTLAAVGLVVIRPSRGTTVRKLSRDDMPPCSKFRPVFRPGSNAFALSATAMKATGPPPRAQEMAKQLGNLLALHIARAWDRVKDTI
ncbi:MAG: GntR family transcriptional regulator [Rhodobacteraceae bacterium]|nr:GntR family transcriptional regulator [Paracoccaceae bacterium]